jgi:hypothetical protein
LEWEAEREVGKEAERELGKEAEREAEMAVVDQLVWL